MTARRSRVSLAILLTWAWTGRAEAQSAPTCAFDPATATLTVTVDGLRANITRPGGQIRLNGVDCAGATTTTTDTIVVNGGALDDLVTLGGADGYRPGLTPEHVRRSEIEISFNLAGGRFDEVRLRFTDVAQTVTATAGGIDIRNDGDEDITTAGVERVRIYTSSSSDTIHAEAYLGGGRLFLYGGAGDDVLYGSPQADSLYGEDGNDTLYGLVGRDSLTGGPGNDIAYGDAGNDTFFGDAIADGSDVFHGGTGEDRVSYEFRTSSVNVTLGNGAADDGEPGEGDSVDLDVEDAWGGDGADILVGSSKANWLNGRGGDDEVYGGAGDDLVYGDLGNDLVFGDEGDDNVSGWKGDDVLIGGDGADYFEGNDGNDTIYNADAFADRIYCGEGVDDIEDDPLDTEPLNDCEL